MTKTIEAVVIGAGISGMCAAHHLGKALGPENLLVLEAGDAPGGTARTEVVEGYVLEWGPNGFLDKEPKTLQWVEELGLSEELVRAEDAASHRFVLKNGQLHEVLPPPRFLLSPLLSLRGRARLLCEPFIPARRDDAPESVWHFAARRIGREAADTLVSPMVTGIFGGDAKQLSLQHCFPRMAEMERKHGGLYKALKAKRRANKHVSTMGPSGKLTCFPQGIGRLAQRTAEHLGERLRLQSPVQAVRRIPGGYEIETADAQTFQTRRLVVATPAHAAGHFLRPLDASLAAALSDIPYASIAVFCTAFDRSQIGHNLDGFGFLVPPKEGLRSLGCLWTSSIFPNQAPAGKVLLRTMYGGARDPEAVKLDDQQLLALFMKELAPVLRLEGVPELMKVFRWERGIPQYDLRHGQRLAVIDAANRNLPGLELAGNAYHGAGLNDCVLSAHAAVERLLAEGAVDADYARMRA